MEFGEEGGEEAEGVYVVDIIKDKRIVSGLVEYLVAWKGYPNADDDTWEKLATLGAAKEAVQLFETNEQAGAAGLLHAKQMQLRAAWKASVGGAREVVKERFERLELQGKPVKVFDTANEAEVEELHAALKVSAMCTHTSTCTPQPAPSMYTLTQTVDRPGLRSVDQRDGAVREENADPARAHQRPDALPGLHLLLLPPSLRVH